ncbi:MAG: methyltransferase [Planctomycetes bacterium]|nr:methyltransferase [Planctomycetota bacterium]
MSEAPAGDARWFGVPMRTERIHCACGELRIRIPREVNDLLRRSSALVADAARREHPHWAVLWPASVALARQVARGPALDGICAVDMGCGAGLAGVAAGKRGATVVFADRAPEALALAHANAAQNGVPHFATRTFDWSRDALPAECRLLLLADLCYNWRAVRPLLQLTDEVLAHGGAVIAADPFRATANDLWVGLFQRGAVADRRDVVLRGERSAIRIATLGPSARGDA